MSALFLDSETASVSEEKSIKETKYKPVGFAATVILLGACLTANFSHYQRRFDLSSEVLPSQRTMGAMATQSGTSLIIPGKSVGPVHLRDTRETGVTFFPLKKDIDREYTYSSGQSEIDWLDQEDNHVQGEIRFFLRDGRIFQIASATPRFRTRSGITIYTSSETAKRNCRDLRSYVLLDSGGEEVGGRDLIYWVSREKGIAFEFHYYPKRHSRLVYSVIVFEPNSDFYPGGKPVLTDKWRELPGYSLEPPKRF
jgi:hypothetical protein